MLMAFPIKSAAQPFLGVGWASSTGEPAARARGFQSDAVELGSSGFGTFVGGLQFQVGRSWPSASIRSPRGAVRTALSTTPATGRCSRSAGCSTGPTHTFTGGLRFGLGSAREEARSGGLLSGAPAGTVQRERAADHDPPPVRFVVATAVSADPGERRDAQGEPSTTNRSGQSAALVMPIRGVATIARRPAPRARPSLPTGA